MTLDDWTYKRCPDGSLMISAPDGDVVAVLPTVAAGLLDVIAIAATVASIDAGRKPVGYPAGFAELWRTLLLLPPAAPFDLHEYAIGDRICRGCGCTDAVACGEGCWWVTADLCSECAPAPVAVQ